MDHVTLVEGQIEDGRKLIATLEQKGFPVVAACWIKTVEDPQWFLYIASPVVDARGGLRSYGQVHKIVRQMPQPFCIEPLDVKLRETTDPVAEAIRETLQRSSGRRPIRYEGDQLGALTIEGLYIYPLPVEVG